MTQKSILSFFVPQSGDEKLETIPSKTSQLEDDTCMNSEFLKSFYRYIPGKASRYSFESTTLCCKLFEWNAGIKNNYIKRFLLISSADNLSKTSISRKRSRIVSSESEEEDSKNNISRQEVAKNNTSKQEVSRHNISRTDLSKQNISKIDLSRQNISRIDLSKQNISLSQKTLHSKSVKISENEFQKPGTSNIYGSLISVNPCFNSYSPNIENYHPVKNACWDQGEKVPYCALAKTFEEIENVSARLKMIEILSNYLRSVIALSPKDLLPSIYLSLNKVGPAHEGLELGLAEQTLIRAISQSTGRSVTQIKHDIQEVGDIGIVAEKSRTSQKLMFKPAPLTVSGVFKKFTQITTMSGKMAVNKKISAIESLLVACKKSEARFLVRSLNGKLRIGLAEQSVLQALARACAMTPPEGHRPMENVNVSSKLSPEAFKTLIDELALIIKTTYCECPNFDLLIPALLAEGVRALPQHCKIRPGLPIKPMLAQPTKGVQEVLSRFDGMEFTCEWKYDGERAQIHCSEDGSVSIYSRNQENNTSKYPDVISRINLTKKKNVTSFILDCEAVAWEPKTNQIQPFQVLSTRKRKDAVESEIKVAVCIFMFDLLYLNGESLVKKTFFNRRRLLRENFKEVKGQWVFATAMDTSKMEEVEEFLEESVKGNCEGLMVKTLNEEATYEIAKRSRNWLKLKKDYLEGVGDTLDLVVLGGYLGKGKRTGTYGGFLVGCYDPESEEYQSVCKLGTGFTDESLAAHTKFFENHIASQAPSYYQYDPSLEPDNWFEPVQVWETKCADLSLSPVHRAAIGVVDPVKGISLRFPRFLRVREDKKPEEATTSNQMIDMYRSQEQVKNQQENTEFNEENFY